MVQRKFRSIDELKLAHRNNTVASRICIMTVDVSSRRHDYSPL